VSLLILHSRSVTDDECSNDEYVKTAATKHPAILGQSGALAWAEIWEIIGPLSARVMEGETISFTDHYLPMLRNGFVEETCTFHSTICAPSHY
jgi:hypothetical protein